MRRRNPRVSHSLFLFALFGMLTLGGKTLANDKDPSDLPAASKADSSKPVDDPDGLIADLLGGPDSDVLDRVTRLMEQSKQRLRSGDTGADTQAVQARIIEGLEDLLRELQNAPKPPCTSCSKPGSMGQPKLSANKPTPTPAPSPSPQSAKSGAASGNPKAAPTSQSSGGSFVSTAEPFLKIAPRLRPAVIEGAGETVCEKYRGLVSDYYKAVAERAVRNEQR